MTADVKGSNRAKERRCDVALSGAEASQALRALARGRMVACVETPVKSGTGTVSLIPAEALETFERPKVGIRKGGPAHLLQTPATWIPKNDCGQRAGAVAQK
jgi:hypothetical protein